MKKSLIGMLGGVALGLGALAGCDDYSSQQAQSSSSVQYGYELNARDAGKIERGKKSVIFILDNSYSMNDKIGDEKKIDGAKKAFEQVLQTYKLHNENFHDLEAGLFCFRSGGALELVALQDFNYDALSSSARNLGLDSGGTPIGRTLAAAECSLNRGTGAEQYIVLLTDGENNNSEDPEIIYKKIVDSDASHNQGPTKLYVVAFSTNRRYFNPLEKLGAKVSDAQNSTELVKSFEEDAGEILAEEPPKYSASQPSK